MTPKEKAKQLISRMWGEENRILDRELCEENYVGIDDAKQCALICVDEMINEMKWLEDTYMVNRWQEVKQEIKKL